MLGTVTIISIVTCRMLQCWQGSCISFNIFMASLTTALPGGFHDLCSHLLANMWLYYTGLACGTNTSVSPPNVVVPRASWCLPSIRHGTALKEWAGNVTSPAGTFQSWNGPNPCSPSTSWKGVNCSQDAVVAITLPGLNLTGPLGPQLASIETLQVLTNLRTFLTLSDKSGITVVWWGSVKEHRRSTSAPTIEKDNVRPQAHYQS